MIARLLQWARHSRALRDFAWITTANLMVKPAWFLFVTAACMRVLGPSGYGVFVSALALMGTFVALSEMGVVEFITREVSRDRSIAVRLFTNLLASRVGLGAVSVVLGIVVGAIGYSETPTGALVAAGLYVLGLRVNELCRALFRATSVFSHDAVSTLVERALTVAAGLAALLIWRTPTAVLAGIAAGAILTAVGTLMWLGWRGSVSGRELDLHVVQGAYRVSFPIGLFALSTIVFHSTGPILLASMISEAEAGQYGAAWRIVELYMLVPSLMTAVALPRLSEMASGRDPEGFRRVLWKSTGALAVVTLGLASGTAWLADPIIGLLAGDAGFGAAVRLLQILSFTFPLMAMSMLFSLTLIASDRQWVTAGIVTASAVVHGVACLIVIPADGSLGVAMAMLSTYAVAVVTAGTILVRDWDGPPSAAVPRPAPSSPGP